MAGGGATAADFQATPAAPKESDPPVQPPPISIDASELRNITVLVADVVQSTQAIFNLDPDEVRAYLVRVTEPMIASVRKYGGAIMSIQGDGIMAVFGAPAATEDHALRACLAAIEIRDAFAAPTPSRGSAKIRTRVGVHSGGAWVRPKSGGPADEVDANGAVVHMATKIERLCPPEAVAASAATIKLIRGYVRSTSLDVLAISPDEAPLPIEQILEISPDYQLEHYFSRRKLSTLVGRAREMLAVTEAFDVLAGSSTMLGLIGEAGMGKSRICYEARAIALRAGFRVAEIRGVSMNSATPFSPLRACLAQMLDAGETPTYEGLLKELDGIGLDQSETAAVAAVIGVAPPDVVWSEMSGEGRKKSIVDGVAKTIRAVAGRVPLLLIVEDLHDVDPETLECIKTAAVRLADIPCCLIVTTRPEGAEALASLPTRVLTLDQLRAPDARRLVLNELRDGDALVRLESTRLVEGVLERANGNPFVLEELSRGLATPSARGIVGVPMSVEILIRARVDKLPAAARRLLQCASVVGMRFPAAFLRALAGLEIDDFERALRELVRERFLVADAGMSVEFAHQITRLACYEGISRAPRARLHGQVLDAAQAGAHRLALSHEASADHAYRAGRADRALDFLWEACRDSMAHSAVVSVAALRRRALDICRELGAPADPRAVDFIVLTFGALQQLGAYPELVGELESSLEISETLNSKRRICHVSGHLATTYWVLGRYDQAHAFARRTLEAAREAQEFPLASYAQFVLGCIQFHRGHIEEAARLEQELVLRLAGKLETARFGAVAVMSVMARSFLTWFLTDLGRFKEAGAAAAGAMRIANGMQQPYSQLLAHSGEGYRLFRMGRFDAACAVLETAYGICRAGSFLALDAIVSGWYAAALVRNGRHEEARRVVQRVIELDLGRHCSLAGSYYVHDSRARLFAHAGRADEALEAIERAVGLMWKTRDRPHYAYAVFTRAELKAKLGICLATCARDYAWAMRRAARLGMRHLEAQCGEALRDLT